MDVFSRRNLDITVAAIGFTPSLDVGTFRDAVGPNASNWLDAAITDGGVLVDDTGGISLTEAGQARLRDLGSHSALEAVAAPTRGAIVGFVDSGARSSSPGHTTGLTGFSSGVVGRQPRRRPYPDSAERSAGTTSLAFFPSSGQCVECGAVFCTFSDGDPWTAAFAANGLGEIGVSGLIDSPQADHAVVVSRGVAYDVNLSARSAASLSATLIPVVDARQSPNLRWLALVTFSEIALLGVHGWREPVNAFDDPEIMAMTDGEVVVRAYDPSSDWIELRIDLDSSGSART